MKTTTLTPPAFLTGRAIEIWNEILPDISAANIAAAVESHALGCYCRAVADLEEAQAAIDEHGLVHKTERGMTKNPATSVRNQAMMHIRQLAQEFGLTPASRSRATFARRTNKSAGT